MRKSLNLLVFFAYYGLMRNKFEIVLLSVGLLTGLLLTWQFLSDVPIESSFPTDEVVAREELLKSYLDEQSYLQSRIVNLRNEIEERQESLEAEVESINLALVEELKKEVGLTEFVGEGLEIILNDSVLIKRDPNDADKRIQASDLRDLVNILNAASAEAIAINGQRIIASSPIAAVGNTILINNSHVAAPFTITAVGDTELMLERVLNKDLLPSLYQKNQNKGVRFEILKKNRISIPIYNGNLAVNYLNLVE